jgi:hypothetical protein
MADIFVGDNDHGDTPVPPLSDLLWAEVTNLRQEVVRLNNVIKELEHIESVRRQKMLHDINWCFEYGGAQDGSLNELLYDLARKEVNDVFDRDNPVTKSYEKIATKYHATFEKLAQEENANEN